MMGWSLLELMLGVVFSHRISTPGADVGDRVQS